MFVFIMNTDPFLLNIKKKLAAKEERYLAPHAAKSCDALRRHPEELEGHRPSFAVDTDRILHSRAYTRYIDKTQVFYMVKNDHITHRVLHVQLVSKIARTIGRVLSLNEDLIESIALGHDIGHPPFGHDGEKILNSLCRENGLASFQHNIQSVRFLENIEKKGRGVNLTVQTLDGILCHDGEVHDRVLCPSGKISLNHFDQKVTAKKENPRCKIVPMTMEGCVVRFADTVSYIGRDIEDAIELKIITRDAIPKKCREILGESNGTIVHNLVTDLIRNSGVDGVAFSQEISQALFEMKQFNYEQIYLNPVIKKDEEKIKKCYNVLFNTYLDELVARNDVHSSFAEYIAKMGEAYCAANHPVSIVCDFIAGMTDDYFLKQASLLGCPTPSKQEWIFA